MQFRHSNPKLRKNQRQLLLDCLSVAVWHQKNIACFPPSELLLRMCRHDPDQLFLCFCSALTDISKSISLYLHDEKSIYRVLAIDLCSRGFHVWQHYIDSLEILRSLINLATNMKKDGISTQNVAAQARQSVLSIASSNMPLLMGTLCLDILSPPTVEHRRSVLQIVAFLIRKVYGI